MKYEFNISQTDYNEKKMYIKSSWFWLKYDDYGDAFLHGGQRILRT